MSKDKQAFKSTTYCYVLYSICTTPTDRDIRHKTTLIQKTLIFHTNNKKYNTRERSDDFIFDCCT